MITWSQYITSGFYQFIFRNHLLYQKIHDGYYPQYLRRKTQIKVSIKYPSDIQNPSLPCDVAPNGSRSSSWISIRVINRLTASTWCFRFISISATLTHPSDLGRSLCDFVFQVAINGFITADKSWIDHGKVILAMTCYEGGLFGYQRLCIVREYMAGSVRSAVCILLAGSYSTRLPVIILPKCISKAIPHWATKQLKDMSRLPVSKLERSQHRHSVWYDIWKVFPFSSY